MKLREWWWALTSYDKDLALLDVALALTIALTPALRRQEWLRDVAWGACMAGLLICGKAIRRHADDLRDAKRRLREWDE